MRAAARDDDRVAAPTRLQALLHPVARREQPRVAAGPRAEHLVEHRRIDDTERWHAVLDQRDVDRELAVAFDEFARAVERIDEEVARPGAPLRPRNLFGGLLRQHRNIAGARREAG